MKMKFTNMQFGLLALIAILFTSCDKEKLEDVMSKESFPNIGLAIQDRIEVAGGDNYILGSSEATIPVKIDFDGPSPKAFTVKLSANLDTVTTLIASGSLPAGTIALEDQTFNFPPVVNIAFGVKSVTFDLKVSRTFLEKNYGKDVALALKISDAAKGNSVLSGKSAAIIIIKTGESIAADAVHYVKFAGTNSMANFPVSSTETGFTLGSSDMTLTLDLLLTGDAGLGFSIEAIKDNSIVTAAIANGTLKDATILDPSFFEISAGVATFEAGKNSAKVNLAIKKDPVTFSPAKKLAFGVKLRNPGRWQLGLTNTTMIVVIDPTYFNTTRKPFETNPYVIKGGIGEVSDPIYASHYDLGGEGVAYHDNGGRDGGQFRRPDQVDVKDGDLAIGWTAASEWLTYTVDVEATGDYEFNVLLGSDNNNGIYSLEFDGVKVTSVLPGKQTGGYDDYQPFKSTVHLTQGRHIMRFVEDNGAYDIQQYIFTRLK